MLDYDAFPQQRQSLIRDLLRKDGRVVCVKLAQVLKVSEHTIRRDLQELAPRRAYASGSMAARLASRRPRAVSPKRREQGLTTKALLGQAGAQTHSRWRLRLHRRRGTTNLAVAQAIPPELSLTVVTNAPAIAEEADEFAALRSHHARWPDAGPNRRGVGRYGAESGPKTCISTSAFSALAPSIPRTV